MLINITLLILSLVAIVLFDAPRLVRQKLWRELCAFAIILVIGYTLAFLRVLEIAFY
ncbi:hypothetical protein L9W92_11310 [Pelotomaculum terephthalicicum JT]|uniref:hypothetical protein n=1 Tax=Pelotomaculum TaxID=191373 RepID=UPI0009D61472|nr:MULTISPECIES: hypothetical protein [Pelotomaculum]MCG9968637.1 hypothetical protein [Pelotomaculum terephthalicicum JT]OPX85261.1 MAG: hypothetical protein A4E54_02519 [Pelotomaculum sp. PtaB.Bin117]OPY62586.1 MAG: hypothetical protein A4E56_01226 [Pelotomaculum sp. PtaU1.Bin065]